MEDVHRDDRGVRFLIRMHQLLYDIRTATADEHVRFYLCILLQISASTLTTRWVCKLLYS